MIKFLIIFAAAVSAALFWGGCRATENTGFSRAVALPALRVEPPDPATGKLYRSDSFLRRFRTARPVSSDDTAVEPVLSEPELAAGGEMEFKPLEPAAGDLTDRADGGNTLLLAVELDTADELKELTLFAGSTGNLKVWLNGTLLHSYGRGPRKLVFCEDEIPGVTLAAGKNLVVVRSEAPSGGLPWQFRLSLADASGRPLRLL